MDCNGKFLDLTRPVAMGILNLTPDSFYDGGYYSGMNSILRQTEKMIREGASIIDMGAISTRPGSLEFPEQMELERLLKPFRELRQNYPSVILSIDTYRSEVARIMIEEGADMINDISGGTFDREMIRLVSKHQIPFAVMHIKGTPLNMQVDPVYSDVVYEVKEFLRQQVKLLTESGHKKILIDPGFGFGKTLSNNYELLNNLHRFKDIGYPILAGVSRKSMINKVLSTQPENALNGTTVINTIALLKGVNILRVHDVREAVQAIRLVEYYQQHER